MAEIQAVWCLQAAPKEMQECQEGAAALMDLAGVEQRQEVSEPTSRFELERLGVECRHRGTELVIRWDGDCRARSLLEVDAATLAALRAHADEAVAGSREAMSETI